MVEVCGRGCPHGGRWRSREHSRDQALDTASRGLPAVASPYPTQIVRQLGETKHLKWTMGAISDSNHNSFFFFFLMKGATSDINQSTDIYGEPSITSIRC